MYICFQTDKNIVPLITVFPEDAHLHVKFNLLGDVHKYTYIFLNSENCVITSSLKKTQLSVYVL